MDEAPLAALRETAVTREPDRYFAATLAPQALRYDLIALSAFASELANIPTQVREPLAGEIRLQWWRDALAAHGGDAAAGHPVAMAMRATIARHALPADLVASAIDSTADRLHGERPPDERALRAHLDAGEGSLFLLAVRICGAEDDQPVRSIARTAGLAYGLSRALARLPVESPALMPIPSNLMTDAELAAASSDKLHDDPQLTAAIAALLSLARAALADIAPQLAKMSRRQRMAFLPLAMVRPNLQALEKWMVRRDSGPIEPLPIKRLLRIAWAHASGRF